jgi:hypothetical protein
LGISQSGNQPLFPVYKSTTPPVFSCFRCTPGGGAFGGALLCATHARAYGLVTVFEKKKKIFGGSILARAGLAPSSDGRVEVTGACVPRLSLRWGVVAQDRWARDTGARARCAHSGKGALSVSQERNKSTQEVQGRSARRRKGRESVAAAQQGKHLARAQPDALLASGACHPAWSNCNIPLQQGESVR